MARWRKDIDITCQQCNGAFEQQEYMESKLNEDESVLVATRMKRQLVGSERCGQHHHHHHHRHRYHNLYHQHNHYYHHHSVIESVIDIILVDVILLISLISELPSRYLVSFAGTRRTGMMDARVAPMVITDTGMIQGSFQ